MIASDVSPGGTVYRLFGVDADDPTIYALATISNIEGASPHDLYDTVVWGDATFMHDLLTGTYAVSPEHERFLADALHELGDVHGDS